MVTTSTTTTSIIETSYITTGCRSEDWAEAWEERTSENQDEDDSSTQTKKSCWTQPGMFIIAAHGTAAICRWCAH